MTAKHDCSARVYGVGNSLARNIRGHECSRNATVQRDGKWYCWQHDPEYVAQKAIERRAAWEAEMNREAAKYKRIARNARLGALVTPELPALLERLAEIVPAWGDWAIYRADLDEARALAARIREALAQEENE